MQSKKSLPLGPSQPSWIIVLKNLGFSLMYFAMILLFNDFCFSVCNSMCFCVCPWVRVFRCVCMCLLLCLCLCVYVYLYFCICGREHVWMCLCIVYVFMCICVFVAVSMWASREPSTPLITIKLIPTTGQIHNFLTARIKDKEQPALSHVVSFSCGLFLMGFRSSGMRTTQDFQFRQSLKRATFD